MAQQCFQDVRREILHQVFVARATLDSGVGLKRNARQDFYRQPEVRSRELLQIGQGRPLALLKRAQWQEIDRVRDRGGNVVWRPLEAFERLAALLV